MEFVGRKIKASKWRPKKYLDDGETSADALTGNAGCLRTRGGELSLWYCDGSEGGIKDVVLALSCTRDRPAAITLVLIDVEWLDEHGINLDRDEQGKTPVDDINERHVNAVGLDLNRICALARYVAQHFQHGETDRIFDFTKKEVKDILRRATAKGRVDTSRLKESMLRYLD